ncbi:MAG: ribosomal protein S18-alanine N-acetyltransferase [Chloroflexota bacterium]
MRFTIEPMRVEHIPTVGRIEKKCFPQPWPQNAYRKEIQTNRNAHYFIIRAIQEENDAERLHRNLNGIANGQANPDPDGRQEGGLLARLSRFLKGQAAPEAHEADEDPDAPPIVGYCGLWLVTDEAHITTIAVDPAYQGLGVGEMLLVGMIDRATQIKAQWLTLEVRVTNQVAQALYRKYTFKEMGLRRRYYSDNGEDALVMWTDPISSDTFQEALRKHRAALAHKLGALRR